MSDALAVVVATVGRPDAALEVLRDLLLQLGPGDEVVVVDQSAPAERAPVAAFCEGAVGLRHVEADLRSLPAARNRGIAETTAPIVLFLDDDVRLHPGCLAGHRRAYRDPTVGGVVGRIVERSLAPNARQTTNRVDRGGRIRTRLDGREACEIETLKGANMSFRRLALVEAGPFDEGYGGTALLEDADQSVRVRAAGWRLRFEPEAGVDHLHLPSGGVRVGDELATARWRLHNIAQFVRRHGRVRDRPRVVATQVVVAARSALRARHLRGLRSLLAAYAVGWRGAR
jgi:GT2 family glycosyltransferase